MLNIGLMGRWLHYLPFVCGLFGLGYLVKASGMIGRSLNSRTWKIISRMFATAQSYVLGGRAQRRETTKPPEGKGTAKHAPIIFAMCCAMVGGYLVNHLRPRYPSDHRENVWVWNESRELPESWGIWTPKYGWERWDCCPDFPCDRVVKVGWIADDVTYEERGNCKSIRAEGLGWHWHKNNSLGRPIYSEEQNVRIAAR